MTREESLVDFTRTIKIKPETARLADVRRFVDEVAADLGLDAEKIFDLKVAVSEACANAVKHAGRDTSALEVSASRNGGRLTFAVADTGTFRIPTPDRDEESRGLGLPLMVALMDEVTFSRAPGKGTKVSLTVMIPQAEED